MNPFGLSEGMVYVFTSQGLVSDYRLNVQNAPLRVFWPASKAHDCSWLGRSGKESWHLLSRLVVGFLRTHGWVVIDVLRRRNRGLRRWNNWAKVILQVSGRDRLPVQDARVQIHLTAKAHNYFWLAVLILALVVPSAGWMTSNRPLSFGGFMSEIPAGSACVLYACPWTIKMRVFGSFRRL